MKHCKLATVSALWAASLLTGCATLFVGPEQDISVQTAPSANLRIINEKTNLEVFSGPTPAIVTLERSERYQVIVSKRGYQTKSFRLKKDLRYWFLCNALCAPLALIDFLNGSTFELEPEQVSITLEPVGRVSASGERGVSELSAESRSWRSRDGGLELVVRARDEQGQLRMLAMPFTMQRSHSAL